MYAKASFADNIDYYSQLRLIILLCDEQGRFHVIDFASMKCRRVVRSILDGEVYAFADVFDKTFMVHHDLGKIYKRTIPLRIYSDSLQMFHVITMLSSTTERRLMIGICAAREA